MYVHMYQRIDIVNMYNVLYIQSITEIFEHYHIIELFCSRIIILLYFYII